MGRGLAQEHRSGMGSALGCLGRRCRAGSMALDGEAALGAGNSPECGVPVPGVAYNFEDLAQKKREGLAMLTEAWSGRGATQVAPVARTGGGARRSLWSGRWGAPPVSEVALVDAVCYCEAEKRGQSWLNHAGGMELLGLELTYGGGVGWKSGACEAEIEKGWLGETPDVGAVLLRGLARAPV